MSTKCGGKKKSSKTTRAKRKKVTNEEYVVMANCLANGSIEFLNLDRSNLKSDRTVILVNEQSKEIFVWIGKDTGRIQRSIVLRQSKSIKKSGLPITGNVNIGSGFDLYEIFEAEIDEKKGDETLMESMMRLDQIFDLEHEPRNGYSVIKEQVQEVAEPSAPIEELEKVVAEASLEPPSLIEEDEVEPIPPLPEKEEIEPTPPIFEEKLEKVAPEPQIEVVKEKPSRLEETLRVEAFTFKTTKTPVQKYVAMVVLNPNGTKEFIKPTKENLVSDKSIIIVDELNEKIFTWTGRETSFIQRSLAGRESASIARYGLQVDSCKIGAKFSRVVIEEDLLDDAKIQQEYKQLEKTFQSQMEHKDAYSIVHTEEERPHVFATVEFSAAGKMLESHIGETMMKLETMLPEGESAVNMFRIAQEEERKRKALEKEKALGDVRLSILEGNAALSLIRTYPEALITQKTIEKYEDSEKLQLKAIVNNAPLAEIEITLDKNGRATFTQTTFENEEKEIEFRTHFDTLTKTLNYLQA
ncbi:MAG: hypothetical protein ACFE68_08480 [Candidatus Hodarchaeota archaeon]